MLEENEEEFTHDIEEPGSWAFLLFPVCIFSFMIISLFSFNPWAISEIILI